MAENQLTTSPELTPPESDLVIWDRSDPNSIISMLPTEVSLRMEETAKKDPDLFTMDEFQLQTALRQRSKQINANDNRLRLKFWSEYDLAKERRSRTMNMTRVIGGICTREFFYKYYLREPGRIAWLLCPPINYLVKANEALEFGLEQMRDILGLSHVDSKGKIDAKHAALKITIFKLLEDRIRGSVVQKTENKTVQLTYNKMDRKMVIEAAQGLSEKDLERSIKELEYREKKALHLPVPEELTPDFVPLAPAEKAHDE